MASLYKKVISGRPYWYLREMARVDGTPKMVSERYLGTAAEIEALLDAREAAVLPERTRHLLDVAASAFGVEAGVAGDELGEQCADRAEYPLDVALLPARSAVDRLEIDAQEVAGGPEVA